ncbi:MAG: acyltransferase family protein, partial [Candidatus Dormibacteraceae bacterium]
MTTAAASLHDVEAPAVGARVGNSPGNSKPNFVKRAVGSLLNHYRAPRILGLDIMRVTASATIVAYHANYVASNLHFGPLKDGYLAVDVFFILSGWLLTGQALAMRSKISSRGQFIWRFWIRRWLRTLPPYWALLTILFFTGGVLWFAFDLRHYLIRAVFLQSVFEPYPYGVTWSLITEEWFYLLLPILIIASPRLPHRLAWTLAVGLGLLLPTLIRGYLVATTDASNLAGFAVPITGTYDRYEGLVLGAGLAVASTVGKSWYVWLRNRRTVVFCLSTAAIAILLLADRSEAAWFRVPGILCFDLLAAACLPFMVSLRWPVRSPAVIRVAFTYLAELTYPIYLIHLIVIRRTGILKPHPGLYVATTIVLILLASSILH